MRKRHSFTREFKIAAVKKVLEKGVSFPEVAQELGNRDTLIHKWRRAFEADGSLQSEILNSPSKVEDANQQHCQAGREPTIEWDKQKK